MGSGAGKQQATVTVQPVAAAPSADGKQEAEVDATSTRSPTPELPPVPRSDGNSKESNGGDKRVKKTVSFHEKEASIVMIDKAGGSVAGGARGGRNENLPPMYRPQEASASGTASGRRRSSWQVAATYDSEGPGDSIRRSNSWQNRAGGWSSENDDLRVSDVEALQLPIGAPLRRPDDVEPPSPLTPGTPATPAKEKRTRTSVDAASPTVRTPQRVQVNKKQPIRNPGVLGLMYG